MGPPDQCQHAASIITDLLQSIRAREEGGQGVGAACSSTAQAENRGEVLLLNNTVCFLRVPQALAQGCPLVDGAEAEAREAGGLRVER